MSVSASDPALAAPVLAPVPAPVAAGARAAARPHVPALDGVRGTAALMVMGYHYVSRIPASGRLARAVVGAAAVGWSGVQLFFVLSGFLITGILLDTREDAGYFRTFYRRRALRIFPLYYAFVALYVFVIAPHLPDGVSTIASRQGWLWTYLVNVDIAAHGWFAGNDAHANNLWSLAIEEQFYLVLPALVLLLSRRGLAWVAVACVAGSIVGRAALAHFGYPARVGYVLTVTQLDGLGLGALLALCYRERGWFERLVPPARVVAPAALLVVAVLARRRGFDIGDWRVLELGLPALAVGFAALLVLVLARGGSAALRAAFATRTLRFFGRYSYGLYIWHSLVGRLLRVVGVTDAVVARYVPWGGLVPFVIVALKVAAAVGVAMVSYAVIEQPFLSLKDRRRGVPSPAGGAPVLTA